MKLTKLIERTLYKKKYEDEISDFFKKVVRHIEILEEDKMYFEPEYNMMDKYSGRNDSPTIIKRFIEEKYKKSYCPNPRFDYFTKSEKVNYLILRNKIDKLLGIKDTSYEI